MSMSIQQGALVVTSISGPNAVLKSLADGAAQHGIPFILIGDSKSPGTFDLPGCEFHGLAAQRELPFAFARLCHERSYTRKNIGYLLAMSRGTQFIIETDDDNYPREGFWSSRHPTVEGNRIATGDWLNAYAYFSETSIYPRGFPLEKLNPSAGRAGLPPRGETTHVHCPIQQGLADANPDVDAIYRMLLPLPLDFDQAPPLILGPQTWCPFNSQNTTTFREAFPLLYLPTFCTFRMTDIWRSFIAQRILWACGWNLSFHSSTVWQERNEHDLLKDFADEIPGYLNNARIARTLDALELVSDPAAMGENLRRCYEALIGMGLIQAGELVLLDAWLDDVKTATTQNRTYQKET